MLLQAKGHKKVNREKRGKNKKSQRLTIFHKKNRRGLSIVIGYVLLIVISIVMSIVVFQWLRNYVPKDTASCPDGTSVFIRDVTYNCSNGTLSIIIKNNGKFSIDGFFIHAANVSGSIATIDISQRLMSGGNWSGSEIVYSFMTPNALTPEEPSNVKLSVFNVTGMGILNKVEILPTRIQEQDNKKRVVSCGNTKVEESLTCS